MVGSSVVNALSSSFIATSQRDQQTTSIEFTKGNLSSEEKPSKVRSKSTSTSVYFELDADIFEEFCSANDILELIHETALINTGLEIIYTNDNDPSLDVTYKYTNGIIDSLNFYTSEKNRLINPVTFSDVCDDFKLSIAFAYNNKIEDETILSFCNTIRTSEHGTHVTGFKRVISQYLTQYIKEKKLVKEEIINDDVFSGLEAVISIFTFEPKYSSQTKQKLENKEINGYVFKVANKFVQDWLNENPKEIQKLATKFALVARARIAAKKALEAVKKDATNLSIPANLDKFADCISNSAADECELWIVEGSSAGGSIKEARNNHNQAVYELKGKPLNCLKYDNEAILKNTEMSTLLENIINVGLRENVDLSKTKFTKIIIASDADSDG